MKIRSVVFMAVAGVLLIAAIAFAVSTIRFLRSSEVVPGRVEKLNAGPAHPEVVFVTGKGERISYPQGGLVRAEAGEAVQVRYDPANPRITATLDRFWAIWTWTTGCLVLAICFGWLGLSAFWEVD